MGKEWIVAIWVPLILLGLATVGKLMWFFLKRSIWGEMQEIKKGMKQMQDSFEKNILVLTASLKEVMAEARHTVTDSACKRNQESCKQAMMGEMHAEFKSLRDNINGMRTGLSDLTRRIDIHIDKE